MDWSDDAKRIMFEYESIGGDAPVNNGFYEGKRLLNITVTNWKEDLDRHLLFSWELYLQYPKWFIDGIVGRRSLSDDEIQWSENMSGHLYPRVSFDDLHSGDKAHYFDLLNIQYMHESIARLSPK